MVLNTINIPFPDFELNEVINPEEFDANNLEIQTKANLAIIAVNDNTVELGNLNTIKADKVDTYTKTEVDDIEYVLIYQIDENINDIDALKSGKADDSDVIHKVGNETISGVKTFSDLPIIPITPTSNAQLSSKAYVDNKFSGAALSIAPDNSIEEIKQHPTVKTGQLSALTTVDKTNLVSAVNEVELNNNTLSNDINLLNGEFEVNAILKGIERPFYWLDSFYGGPTPVYYIKNLAGDIVLTKEIDYASTRCFAFGKDSLFFCEKNTAQNKVHLHEYDLLTFAEIRDVILPIPDGSSPSSIAVLDDNRIFLNYSFSYLVELSYVDFSVINTTNIGINEYKALTGCGDRLFGAYDSTVDNVVEISTTSLLQINVSPVAIVNPTYLIVYDKELLIRESGSFTWSYLDKDTLVIGGLSSFTTSNNKDICGRNIKNKLEINEVEINNITYTLTAPITAD